MESHTNMRDYRTIDDVTEEYLRNHPDEIDDYIAELFEEYAQDGKFESVNAILHAMGYLLAPRKR